MKKKIILVLMIFIVFILSIYVNAFIISDANYEKTSDENGFLHIEIYNNKNKIAEDVKIQTIVMNEGNIRTSDNFDINQYKKYNKIVEIENLNDDEETIVKVIVKNKDYRKVKYIRIE